MWGYLPAQGPLANRRRRWYKVAVYVENVVIDALNPRVLGRFWEGLLGTETLTDAADIFETRLIVPDGPVLDLCFQQVSVAPSPAPRLHLDIAGGERQGEVVEHALRLGARHLDIGQGDMPWVVLADPEGNAFCVMEARPEYAQSGPIAAVPVDSRDPAHDLRFWTELSGWLAEDTSMPAAMRHPSGRGPLIEFCPEGAPKGSRKNRLHLDLRLESGDDPNAVLPRIHDLGGHELHPDWGDLPWQVLADPSGNEFCLLPARSG